MPTKAELSAQMAEKVTTQLTGSWQEWAGFLTTASRLYKYPFHEQLMKMCIRDRCEMTRFTDSPYERIMTRRPEGGKETSRPPSLPHSHPCYGCGNYGRPCVDVYKRQPA